MNTLRTKKTFIPQFSQLSIDITYKKRKEEPEN